jgi:hypothetical protein
MKKFAKNCNRELVVLMLGKYKLKHWPKTSEIKKTLKLLSYAILARKKVNYFSTYVNNVLALFNAKPYAVSRQEGSDEKKTKGFRVPSLARPNFQIGRD